MSDDDDEFISVSCDGELIECPLEEDNTLLLTTLKGHFPNAIGLKYQGPNGAWRALRDVQGKLKPPKKGWETRIYSVKLYDAAVNVNANVVNQNTLNKDGAVGTPHQEQCPSGDTCASGNQQTCGEESAVKVTAHPVQCTNEDIDIPDADSSNLPQSMENLHISKENIPVARVTPMIPCQDVITEDPDEPKRNICILPSDTPSNITSAMVMPRENFPDIAGAMKNEEEYMKKGGLLSELRQHKHEEYQRAKGAGTMDESQGDENSNTSKQSSKILRNQEKKIHGLRDLATPNLATPNDHVSQAYYPGVTETEHIDPPSLSSLPDEAADEAATVYTSQQHKENDHAGVQRFWVENFDFRNVREEKNYQISAKKAYAIYKKSRQFLKYDMNFSTFTMHSKEVKGLKRCSDLEQLQFLALPAPTMECLNYDHVENLAVKLDDISAGINWLLLGQQVFKEKKEVWPQIRSLSTSYAGGGSPGKAFIGYMDTSCNCTVNYFLSVCTKFKRMDISQRIQKCKPNGGMKFNDLDEQVKSDIGILLDHSGAGIKGWRDFAYAFKCDEDDVSYFQQAVRANAQSSPTKGLISLIKQIIPNYRLGKFVEDFSVLGRNDMKRYIFDVTKLLHDV